ncbi:hypothetical protein EDC04DRAFT_2842083 [Pisolithus marmoratus]|nr:hypothetical protein EDC04DRAFT_2842083 [Pisolithus marmoratus]
MADNSVSLWDLERGEVDSPHLEGGKELPLYVAWSPDNRTVSSVAQDATLRVWSVESRQCMSESHRTMGPITYSPSSNFIVCPGDDGSPDIWDVPQKMPATAASMHYTAGATESDAFWSISGDPQAPVMSTQHAQHPRKPDSPLGLNTSCKAKGFFSRILERLSVRGRESGAIPPTECGNLANVAPETRRGMPRSRRTTATQHPRTPGITNDVSDESEVSVVPGCSLCCRDLVMSAIVTTSFH